MNIDITKYFGQLIFPDLTKQIFTQNLGRQWKLLEEAEKAVYREEAERLRLLHLKEFPDYKYKPKKRTRYFLNSISYSILHFTSGLATTLLD